MMRYYLNVQFRGQRVNRGISVFKLLVPTKSVFVVVVVVDDDDNDYNNKTKWALFLPGPIHLYVWLEGASSGACNIFLNDRKPNSGTRSLSNLRYLCCLVFRCRKPVVDNLLWVLNEVIYIRI